MNNLKFKLNWRGVSKLLRSQKAADVCGEFAKNIQQRCGDGYEVTLHPAGKTRSNASVYAKTLEAKKDNFENNTLEKALY